MTILDETHKIESGGQKRTRKVFPLDEEIELAYAWIKHEVTTKQVTEALGIASISPTSVYCFIATTLRREYKREKLIEENQNKAL